MKFSRSRLVLVVSALLVLSSSAICRADGVRNGPFHNSCLNGRYTMATTGWDVTVNFPPGTPFALTGYVVTQCTGQGTGTYTGEFFATYPTVPGPPIVCAITGGTYFIDPGSGALTSSATLADVTTNSCAAFGNKSLSESGFLSDPTGRQFYQVETGQQVTAGAPTGDTIHYIWTKQ